MIRAVNIPHLGIVQQFVIKGFISIIEFKRSGPTKAMREGKEASYPYPNC